MGEPGSGAASIVACNCTSTGALASSSSPFPAQVGGLLCVNEHSGGQSQLTLPQMQAALAQLGFALDMQPDGAFYKLCQSCECPNPTRHSTPRAAPGAPCCTVHATPPPSCTRPAWPSYTPCRPASPVDDFEKRGAFGLDAFMAMAVTLTNAKAIYGLFDPQNTGKVTMDFNQFVWSIAQL